ncbi:hypothetical protein NLJ89_g8446 [Agrocybe chaxingu]|uniref:Peptidase M43 pregnancy-associated plasma-A domain-containing protein n=1 Tax=Agrocybe chaxingu TaxID=84603 RepID=A0A9W8JV86_9AGAR|nr:hypothetical protein NLJ89_g8446 [Agrocybe chaxingu]
MVPYIALFFSLLCGASSVVGVRAAGRGCATTISEAQLAASAQHFSTHRKQAPTGLLKAKPLDVYFHVIYKNETLEGGFIPESFITDQMKVLNDDFSKTGLSFSVKNVSRIHHPLWFSELNPYENEYMDVEMKRRYRQGGAADLNVFTVGFEREAETYGYATFPFNYADNPTYDGIVLLYSSMPGGSTVNFNLGRTLTHETGHWVGLYHTFQGGCTGTFHDEVEDTPREARGAVGCPIGQDSCPAGGVDPIHNFMDYSDDACMTHFTPGQITRLKDQIATYRQIVTDVDA